MSLDGQPCRIEGNPSVTDVPSSGGVAYDGTSFPVCPNKLLEKKDGCLDVSVGRIRFLNEFIEHALERHDSLVMLIGVKKD